MNRYQDELLALAREISAEERIPMAEALQMASEQMQSLVAYAFHWEKRSAERQWAQIPVVQTA
jgi:hypothetical protein